jgi:hypothetical protein
MEQWRIKMEAIEAKWNFDAREREIRAKMEAWREADKREMEAREAEYRARKREIDANLRERLANIKATFKKEGTKEQQQPLDGRLGHIEEGRGDAKPVANDAPTLSSTDIQEEVIQNGSEQIMDVEIETSAQTPEAESTTTEELMAKIEAGLRAIIKENLRKMEEKKRAAEETKALPETTEACPEVTHACLEQETEPTPKETEVVTESREVPEGRTDEITSAGTEDRAAEQRLAVRRHRQPRKMVGPGRSLLPSADGLPAAPSLHCSRGMSAGDRV